jgi:hypothetical protein
MTETKAYILVLAVGALGLALTLVVLNALGSSHHVSLVAAMFWLVAPALCVGVVGAHYEPKDGEQNSRSRR